MKRRVPLRRTGLRRKPRAEVGGLPDQTVRVVVRRSGGLCEAGAAARCVGRGEHFHHRLRRSRGGGDEPSNLLHVCHLCHVHIHDHPAESYRTGWLRRGSR